MAVSTPSRPRRLSPAPATGRHRLPGTELAVVLVVAAAAISLSLTTHAHDLRAVPTVARGTLATLVVFGVCGIVLAAVLVPRDWGALRPLLAVPIGAMASALVLTALGIAQVPLRISLWLVLGAGITSAVVLYQRGGRRLLGVRPDRGHLATWVTVLVIVFCLAMIPAWRSGSATIYGENPDAHQVVGIAVLFQHVAPTGTDVALPIDTVPPSWRFRYPIFYPLAAASQLVHLDPISVFSSMAAILVVIAALGFGAVAVTCLRAPPLCGPLVAAAIGLSVIVLHLAWHPYWNQLWGLAILPYALLFGWQALERLDVRLGLACMATVVMLVLAYPLALPDALVLLVALAIAYRRRPRLIALARSRSWLLVAVAVLVLAPAVIGAALKLEQGLSQLFSFNTALWGGDVTTFMPLGRFVGTGGGVIPALVVAAIALLGLRRLPRRVGWAVALGILVLGLVDIRFRVTTLGSYMDFKQLSFVGTLVVTLAVAGVAGLIAGRRPTPVAAGALVGLAWVAAALIQDHGEAKATKPQVTAELFQIRDWARRLPPGASVRVDVPPSGTQLWAVYMLGSHPVDSPTPVLGTTYAHAPYGTRADYSLSLRFYPTPGPGGRPVPFPRPMYARNPPLLQNDEFALRRIVWPPRLGGVAETASQRLVEP